MRNSETSIHPSMILYFSYIYFLIDPIMLNLPKKDIFLMGSLNCY